MKPRNINKGYRIYSRQPNGQKKNESTNFFYAILYSIWRFYVMIASLAIGLGRIFTFCLPIEWRTKANHNYDMAQKKAITPNDNGTATNIAIKIMGFLLMSDFCVFLGPIVKVIKKFGISSYIAAIIVIGMFGIIIFKLKDTFFDDSHYSKYFIKYEKRETSWKLLWGIITFIYIIFSFGCLFYGSESYQSIE